MKIDFFVLGAYQTNCYILRRNETAKDCLIVDIGLEPGELIDFLERDKLNPIAVILTHGHADHITGLVTLRKNYPDTKVYIHKLDAKMLTKPQNNISALTGQLFRTKQADFLVEEGAVIEQAGIKLEVLHTPGHTPGGICLYPKDEKIVFVGDTLFANSVGRVDLGGNMVQLIKSIKEKLLTLPGETIVYPGHGPITTIAQEKAHNPYLQ
jgi:hydroxyacylglutathione hydrolase